MQSSGNHIRKQNNSVRNVWMSAFFLVILVAVTAAFLVSCFLAYIHRSDYQISLYQGLVTKKQTTLDTSTATAVNSTAAQINGNQAQQFDFRVADNQKVWRTDTTIEIFQATYQNDDGQITVHSADDNKVVAPGTGGNYTFSLKNASDLNSNYQVWVEADASVEGSGIPIEFRMAGADGWLDGSGEWLTADELNKEVARKNLYSGKSTEYTLYWRWAFERGEDETDTAYGNIGTGTSADQEMNVSQSVSYRVTLHTLAAEGLIGEDADPTVTPSDNNNRNSDQNNKDQNGNNSYDTNSRTTADDSGSTSRNPVKTSDTTDILSWILLLAAAGIITAAVFHLRNRRKHEN